MKNANPTTGVLAGCVMLLISSAAGAEDWPQWRGPNRDNKVTGFVEPKAWPAAPKLVWKTKVGVGDASPALVGDKVYVFTREGGDEVILCLNAADGKEVWRDKYAATPVQNRAAQGHPGPRSTPAVAEGKVCTLGVSGVLSCLDAATGKVVWRKDSKAWPQFSTASSPLILDGKCIAYLGGQDKGEVVAYDLASGEEKWKWAGDAPAYGSPVLMTVDGTKQLVTPTIKSLVGIGVADGKLLWQMPFKSRYNSGTPVVDGTTVIFSGQGDGTVALKVEKQGDAFTAKELWKKPQATDNYNTPVLKDGLLYGLTSAGGGGGRGKPGGGRGGMMGGGTANIFCMNEQTGDVLWTDKSPRGECGAILDAGPVLLALTSDSNLLAFKPSKTELTEVAKLKVADTPTWAYPIIAGNRVFVKDQDSLTLWTLE
jgi:outer membrane protein assembly factor BamB